MPRPWDKNSHDKGLNPREQSSHSKNFARETTCASSSQHGQELGAVSAGGRRQLPMRASGDWTFVLSTAHGTRLLGGECTAYVPNCSRPSTSELRMIWLGKTTAAVSSWLQCTFSPSDGSYPATRMRMGKVGSWERGQSLVRGRTGGVLAIKGHSPL